MSAGRIVVLRFVVVDNIVAMSESALRRCCLVVVLGLLGCASEPNAPPPASPKAPEPVPAPVVMIDASAPATPATGAAAAEPALPLPALPAKPLCMYEGPHPDDLVIFAEGAMGYVKLRDAGGRVRIAMYPSETLIEFTAPNIHAVGPGSRSPQVKRDIQVGDLTTILRGAHVGSLPPMAPVPLLTYVGERPVGDATCADLTLEEISAPKIAAPSAGHLMIGGAPRDLHARPGGPVVATVTDVGSVDIVERSGPWQKITWMWEGVRVTAWTPVATPKLSREEELRRQMDMMSPPSLNLSVPAELELPQPSQAPRKLRCDRDVTFSFPGRAGALVPLVTLRGIDVETFQSNAGHTLTQTSLSTGAFVALVRDVELASCTPR